MHSTAPVSRFLALKLRALWLPLLLASLALRPGAINAASDGQSEAVGAVVLGILSYARWPKESGVLSLCLVGPTHYADALLRNGQPQINGRTLEVKRRAFDDPWLGEACNAVYLGELSEGERGQLFNALREHAVLSISEDTPDCSVGSMFCLYIKATHVSFAVNLDSVARSGVHVHPAVLKLGQQRRAP